MDQDKIRKLSKQLLKDGKILLDIDRRYFLSLESFDRPCSGFFSRANVFSTLEEATLAWLKKKFE